MFKKSILAISSAAMALALTAVTPQLVNAEPKRGGTLTFAYGCLGPQFNTTIASGTCTGLAGTQMFAALTYIDRNWNVKPLLAESWKFSDDGLSLTLKIRKNAKFHDGMPITSEDVAFSIMTIKAQHPFKTMYGVVERVETPDKHTAVVQMSKKHPAILIAMSTQLGTIIPKHVYSKGDNIRKHPQNSQNIVGSGPFVFKVHKPGEYLLLDRNPTYFLKGKPYLDKIVIRRIKEETPRIIAMEKGEADLSGFWSLPESIKRMSRSKHLSMTNKSYEGFGALQWVAFNTGRKPYDDKRVRQALGYAINKKFVVDALMAGMSVRATGPIHPGSTFYSADVNPYKFNIAKANALLDEAGLKRDSDGIRFKATIDMYPSATLKRIAEYLKSQFKKVGVELSLRASPDFRSWFGHVTQHNFDITMDGVFNWGDPVIGVHRTYLSTNIRKGVPWHNTQQYKNLALDDLMNQAGSELDQTKRKALYAKMQKIVVDEAPIIFLATAPYHTVWNNKRVGNPPIESVWGLSTPWHDVYIK